MPARSIDSIDTVAVMKELKALIGNCNVYISKSDSSANIHLVESAAVYVTGILKVFGVIPDTSTILGFPLENKSAGSSMAITDEVSEISIENQA